MKENLSNNERLIKLSEAANRLSISVRTLYRMIADGELPQPCKVRSRSLLPESVISEYIRKATSRR